MVWRWISEQNMKDDTIKVIAATAAITICYGIAAFNGVNGLAFTTVIASLTGVGSWFIAKRTTE